jgi:hypothetical protein
MIPSLKVAFIFTLALFCHSGGLAAPMEDKYSSLNTNVGRKKSKSYHSSGAHTSRVGDHIIQGEHFDGETWANSRFAGTDPPNYRQEHGSSSFEGAHHFSSSNWSPLYGHNSRGVEPSRASYDDLAASSGNLQPGNLPNAVPMLGEQYNYAEPFSHVSSTSHQGDTLHHGIPIDNYSDNHGVIYPNFSYSEGNENQNVFGNMSFDDSDLLSFGSNGANIPPYLGTHDLHPTINSDEIMQVPHRNKQLPITHQQKAAAIDSRGPAGDAGGSSLAHRTTQEQSNFIQKPPPPMEWSFILPQGEYQLRIDPFYASSEHHLESVYKDLSASNKMIVFDRVTSIRPYDGNVTYHLKVHLTATYARALLSQNTTMWEIAALHLFPDGYMSSPPVSWMTGFKNSERKEVIRKLSDTTFQRPDHLRKLFLSLHPQLGHQIGEKVLVAQNIKDIWELVHIYDLVLPSLEDDENKKEKKQGIGPWQVGLSHLQRTALRQRITELGNIGNDTFYNFMNKEKVKPGYGLVMLKVDDDVLRVIVTELAMAGTDPLPLSDRLEYMRSFCPASLLDKEQRIVRIVGRKTRKSKMNHG